MHVRLHQTTVEPPIKDPPSKGQPPNKLFVLYSEAPLYTEINSFNKALYISVQFIVREPKGLAPQCFRIFISHEYTVEPLNKGHFGSSLFVLYTEVVLCSEAK